MSKQTYVFEIGQQSFGESVLLNSHKIPVVVEFMGVWSEPCVSMADLFSQLAKEFAEEFIFAKIDIDEQVELREQYKITNVPTVMVFKDGESVRTEVGELKEAEARGLLKDFGVFNEIDDMRAQARDKHLSGDAPGAILLLTKAIKKDPANTRVAMDMVQIFIDIGEVAQAKGLYAKLPEVDRKTDMGQSIQSQFAFLDLAAKTVGIDVLTQKITTDPDDFDAHFDIAICLISQHQYEEAIKHLFYVVEKDKDYKGGGVREMIVVATNMIASMNVELAQEYKRKLANILSA